MLIKRCNCQRVRNVRFGCLFWPVCHVRQGEGAVCHVRQGEGAVCHLRQGEGAVCHVRQGEGLSVM